MLALARRAPLFWATFAGMVLFSYATLIVAIWCVRNGHPRMFVGLSFATYIPLALGLAAIVRIGERYRPRVWLAHGLCPECGYNLRGNVSGICPECGGVAKPVAAAPGKPGK